MKETKKLFLLRGCPGSGKSTLAESLKLLYVEADMFYIRFNGVYEWRAEDVKAAHKWCISSVEDIMLLGNDVAVANTFTQEWEMKPYYELAEKYGYIVFSLVVENRHGGVNKHNVPTEVLEKMKNRFELKLI